MQDFIGTFDEPQKPKKHQNLQNPFHPVCDSWQEHALSPGEAAPAGPFLWKGLFRTFEELENLKNLFPPVIPVSS